MTDETKYLIECNEGIIMPLTTIPYEGRELLDRNFISDNQKSTGVVASLANRQPIGLTGKEMQYINFEGDPGVFSEGYPNAAENEKVKTSNDANNYSRQVFPVTMQTSYRFPKKFLQLFAPGDAYANDFPIDEYRIGDPYSKLTEILAQPWQTTMLEQFKGHINTSISRGLDKSTQFGLNPQFNTVSPTVRRNPFLVESGNTGDNAWRNATVMAWTPDTPQKPGSTPAGNAFEAAVTDLATHNEFTVQAVMSPWYENQIRKETTTIGSPAPLAQGLPMVATNVSIGNVYTALSGLLTDDLVSASGAFPAGTHVDAIVGNFSRIYWDMMPLGDIIVMDSGNPDHGRDDLGALNEVMLRFEYVIAWTIVGGASMFRVITHTDTPAGTRSTKN